MSFGNGLRAYRTRRGLSQAALAARVGVDQGHISKIERGEVTPLVTFAKRLADEVQGRVDDLIEFRESEEVAA